MPQLIDDDKDVRIKDEELYKEWEDSILNWEEDDDVLNWEEE